MPRKSKQTVATAIGSRFVIVLEGPGGRGYLTNVGTFDRKDALARRFVSADLAAAKLEQVRIAKGLFGLKVEPERIAD